MIDATDITGLFSSVLLGTTLISCLLPLGRLSGIGRCLILASIAVLLLVPLHEVSAALFVRGFVGDLSILSVVVLIMILIERTLGAPPLMRPEVDRLCLLLVPLGLLFYPLAIGFGRYDPYSLGYGSPYLLGFVFVLTLAAWRAERWWIASSLSLAVFCYAIGWYESNNLWDYLIDPLLTVYGLGLVVARSLPRGRPLLRRFVEADTSQ